jgi:hypothetical protein
MQLRYVLKEIRFGDGSKISKAQCTFRVRPADDVPGLISAAEIDITFRVNFKPGVDPALQEVAQLAGEQVHALLDADAVTAHLQAIRDFEAAQDAARVASRPPLGSD